MVSSSASNCVSPAVRTAMVTVSLEPFPCQRQCASIVNLRSRIKPVCWTNTSPQVAFRAARPPRAREGFPDVARTTRGEGRDGPDDVSALRAIFGRGSRSGFYDDSSLVFATTFGTPLDA